MESEMTKNIAEIVCILDRSGSMSGLAESTIEGYNKFIAEQREIGPGRVTLVLFDTQYEVVYEDMALSQVPDLTEQVYYVRGSTALLDAVGKTINLVKERHLSDRPNKTMFLIVTDGWENASKEYTEEGLVKPLVRECREDLNWEFYYLGANVDSFVEAANMGIPAAFAANYDPSLSGTRDLYAATSSAFGSSRSGDTKAVSESGMTMTNYMDLQKSSNGDEGDDDDEETKSAIPA